MAPKKLEVPSERWRIDGNQRMPITDAREQKFWDWYLEMRKARKAAPMAKMLIIAALHGELGTHVQEAVEKGNTEEAHEALGDLLGEFLS